jgi:glycosyltransferase involved in cell wall biosynthesis
MKTQMLSIVTYSYKDPEGFAKTIQSFQTLSELETPFEIIFVDSSPLLNSKSIDDYGKNLNLRTFITPPEGIYSAMNYGLSQSSGDIIWFLQGGDELLNIKALKYAVKTMEKNPHLDILASGVRVIENQKTCFDYFPSTYLEKNLQGRSGMSTQGILFRRKVFEKVGGFDTRWSHCADFLFFWNCYLNQLIFKAGDQILATHKRGGESSDWKTLFLQFHGIQKQIAPKLSPKQRFCNSSFFLLKYIQAHLAHHVKKNKKLNWLVKIRRKIPLAQVP